MKNTIFYILLVLVSHLSIVEATQATDLISKLCAAIAPTGTWPTISMPVRERLVRMTQLEDETSLRIMSVSNLVTQISTLCAHSALMQSAVVHTILQGYVRNETSRLSRVEYFIMPRLSSLLQLSLLHAPKAYIACAHTILSDPTRWNCDPDVWLYNLHMLYTTSDAEPQLGALYTGLITNTSATIDVRLRALVRLTRDNICPKGLHQNQMITNWFACIAKSAATDRDRVKLWSTGVTVGLHSDWCLTQLWNTAHSDSYACDHALDCLEAHYENSPPTSQVRQQLHHMRWSFHTNLHNRAEVRLR